MNMSINHPGKHPFVFTIDDIGFRLNTFRNIVLEYFRYLAIFDKEGPLKSIPLVNNLGLIDKHGFHLLEN